jgi:hygromycin-B 4-O-kinase
MPTLIGVQCKMEPSMLMIDARIVTSFLKSYFDSEISDVRLIGAGMFSQAFSFNLNQQGFVIRFNPYKEDFLKDALAYQQFASTSLPIPNLIECDRFNQYYYFAISERCLGRTLDNLEETSIRNILSSLFETLHVIHTLDISNYSGWGLTDASGCGRFVSWEEYLLSFYNQKFVFTWEQLFNNTCMEPKVYEMYFNIIKDNLKFCSVDKYWVHGDFGFDNVVSDGERVTGVLDWAESRLGDFVYDIAYLNFWSKTISYKQLWQEWSKHKKLDTCNFEKRMHCYMLHIGLGSLAIAAVQDNIEDYTQVKARMQTIVAVT